MAKDPAFLFYPGDYLRDTQNLSEKSQVAYDRIMCEHMRNICEDMINIIVSKKQVNFFIKRLSEEEKEELFFVLTKIGDNYQIEWVAESIAKRKSYSNSRSKNRQSINKKHMKTYEGHMENENVIENIIKDDYLKSVQEFLKGELIKISFDEVKKEAQSFINQRLVEGDIHKTFPEYANHFINSLKKKHEKKTPPKNKKINDTWND